MRVGGIVQRVEVAEHRLEVGSGQLAEPGEERGGVDRVDGFGLRLRMLHDRTHVRMIPPTWDSYPVGWDHAVVRDRPWLLGP